MHFLPVFLDLRRGQVGLVGCEPAAVNKLRLLQAAGARVRWYLSETPAAEAAMACMPSAPG